MKIAITSSGNDLDSKVDPRFGRAEKFIIYDMESNKYEVIDNTLNKNAVQGAGVQSGEIISQSGAECVLTGDCGPKALRTLETANIKVYTGAEGTVKDAIEKFKKEVLGK